MTGHVMGRREFITLVGGAAIAWPLAAHAQQGERMQRIGVLVRHAEGDPELQSWLADFREGLEKLGWSSCPLPEGELTQRGHHCWSLHDP